MPPIKHSFLDATNAEACSAAGSNAVTRTASEIAAHMPVVGMTCLSTHATWHVLCRQATEATSRLTAATDGLSSAQQEVTELKSLAAERQKRFVMLNGTFKKKEDGMRERAEAAERQMVELQSTADTAVAASQLAAKVSACHWMLTDRCCCYKNLLLLLLVCSLLLNCTTHCAQLLQTVLAISAVIRASLHKVTLRECTVVQDIQQHVM